MSSKLIELNYRKISLPNLSVLADNYDKMVKESNMVEHTEELEHNFNPYRISLAQNYSPIYDRIFVLNEKNYNLVGLNSDYYISGNYAVHSSNKKSKIEFDEIHVKSSPIVDPFHYLCGKYEKYGNNICALPQYGGNASDGERVSRLHKKINDHSNSCYVDAFFSYLAGKLKHTYNVYNAVDFYGICLGIQDVFKVDITDDLSYLHSIPFFNENLGKRFVVSQRHINEYMDLGSRANRCPIKIDDIADEKIELDFETLDGGVEYSCSCPWSVAERKGEYLDEDEKCCSEKESKELVYESKKGTASSCDSSSDDDSDLSDNDNDNDKHMLDSDAKHDNDGSEMDSSVESSEFESALGESNIYSFIYKFPVQLIFMEKCTATLDQLFVDNVLNTPDVFAATFMQIIMTLITYQKAFQFTHNDLHTNNILYKETVTEFVYYKYNGRIYKVPTYGRIFKIIDFGRSIYRFNGEIYCSDSYSKGADAYGQYNCEPYFNPSKPRIDTNFSFDLARLGSSIYGFLDEKHTDKHIFDTINRWCTDDNGKNIVERPNGEERWPGFTLYKMIARHVHKHTPQAQLEFPMFKQFLLKSGKFNMDQVKKWFLDIDSIPGTN